MWEESGIDKASELTAISFINYFRLSSLSPFSFYLSLLQFPLIFNLQLPQHSKQTPTLNNTQRKSTTTYN